MGRNQIVPGLGKSLKDAREERGWSQDDLASRTEALGEPVSKNAISRIERDLMSPTAGVLLSLCRALEVDPNEVLRWSESDADQFAADVRKVARWMLDVSGDEARFREIVAAYDEPTLEDPRDGKDGKGARGVGTPRQEAG